MEIRMAEQNVEQENMDITVSHTMGYDSYQREKVFESMSLKGDIQLGNDIRLVMMYKELVLIYMQLSTYRRLKENLWLEDKAFVVKGDGTKTKTLEESNEFGYEDRKNGLSVSLVRLENTLEELEKVLESDQDKVLLSKADNLMGIIMTEFYG